MSGPPEYFAADAEHETELSRLRLQEAEHDPHTFRHLSNVGVGQGWRCLEVGAGTGSVVRWLAERVGPTGRVVAADIDTRFLGGLSGPTVEVRRSDITADDVEHDYYDLVHSRLLLMHMADPADILRRMAAALRPGGWLVAEEIDGAVYESVDPSHPLASAFDSYSKKLQSISTTGLMDVRLGRTLPVRVEALGLVDQGNEGTTRTIRGGEPFSRMLLESALQFDPVLVDKGLLTEAEVTATRQAWEDPNFLYRRALMQSVWARKPVSL